MWEHQMTKLLKVEVNGLAGRKDPVKFDLRPDVNIFFGLNGSGKTSLLKILHSGLEDRTVGLAKVPFTSASIKVTSKVHKTLERSIVARRPRSRSTLAERKYQTAMQQAITAQDPSISTDLAESVARQQLEMGEWTSDPRLPSGRHGLRHRYLSTNRLMAQSIPLRRGQTLRISDDELDETFAEQLTQIWRIYTNSLLSEVTDVQSGGLREILRSLIFESPELTEQSPPEARKAYERASHFLGIAPKQQNSSEFRRFLRRFQEEPYFKSVVQGIDEIEQQTEQAEEPRRRLAELISAFISEGKSITFTNREIRAEVSGEEIPLASLSSGEKQLVRILIEVILTEDNVIIIDEPELSMHIDWQRSLVRAMQTVNPAAQIVMATHSPDIMENVSDECIFRL
jgi:predicted ATP-binding protein involved in virulence